MLIRSQSKGPILDRFICYRWSLRFIAIETIKRVLGRGPTFVSLNGRYSARAARRMILKAKLAVVGNSPSWFYTAFNRGKGDAMTNETLEGIRAEVHTDARILVTGCGTGLTMFWLLESGFSDVTGTDLLPETIEVAQALNSKFYRNGAKFLVDDGFSPQVEGNFEIVTALHWVYSAWAGNYGNDSIGSPFSSETRQRVLEDFLSAYSRVLAPGGVLIIELVDAICDARVAQDLPDGSGQTVYPVRHSMAQVAAAASRQGYSVEKHYFSFTGGLQARMCYSLKKS